MEERDPISDLIMAIDKAAGKASATDGGGELAKAAELIPGRTETSVEDLLNSPELQHLRQHLAKGMVETELLTQALKLVLQFAAARFGLPLP